MYPNRIARKVISMEICRHMTYHLTYQAEVWHIICFRSFYYSEIWMHENKHTKQLIFKTCAKVNTLEICFICLSKNIYGQKTFGNKMCTTISSSGNSQISWFNKNNFLWTFEKLQISLSRQRISTIMVITFWKFIIFQFSFDSPQVKLSLISNIANLV